VTAPDLGLLAGIAGGADFDAFEEGCFEAHLAAMDAGSAIFRRDWLISK
jgi:hypothetical protein